MSHVAASRTGGMFYETKCFEEAVYSKTVGMDEGSLGQMAQEPRSFKTVDHPWTFDCLGGTTV